MDERIFQRLTEFKYLLGTMDTTSIVQSHIAFGDSYILDFNQYFNIKAEVADHFGIHHSEVLLVGSGKMGFSIAPSKRYREFHDKSDIDLAIVSPHLFDMVWQKVFDYWSEKSLWIEEEQNIFKSYLFRGWIRPDKLPPAEQFEFRRDWWEFFLRLTNGEAYGPYQIRAGLYKSWHFFEKYQCICVDGCKQDALATIGVE